MALTISARIRAPGVREIFAANGGAGRMLWRRGVNGSAKPVVVPV